MAPAALTIASDLYGSEQLHTQSDTDISRSFHASGSTSMPLGHNADDRNLGLAFSVGPKGSSSGHALTFGRTRGGKGVSSIIPALLTYSGSMVVIDPKGENAWITAERRRQLGHRVVILDPWDEVNRRYGSKVGVVTQIANFNPLSALDPNFADFADDVTAIAEAFILNTASGDPHWPDSARELVGGLIAAEVQRNPGHASMRAVRQLITAPLSRLKESVDRTIQDYPDSVAARKLEAVVEVDDEGQPLSPREMGSVRSTARTQTAFLDSTRLQQSMETDEPPFNLEDLGTQPVTLYLVLPVDRLKTHGRWLRMILSLAIRAISKLEAPPSPPVVFMLDELGTISPGSGLSMVEQSYGLMAGLGIRIWAFLQDLPQLQRDYPQSWETFISNSSVIQLLNVADATTAEYFSRYLGTSTVNARTGTWSYKQVRWSDPNGWDNLMQQIADEARSEYPSQHSARWQNSNETARQEHERQREKDKTKYPDTPANWIPQYIERPVPEVEMQQVERHIKNRQDFKEQELAHEGITKFYLTEWTPDEQLASRPVLFPAEVMNADEKKAIIIIPGKRNYQLTRFAYYLDPVLSKFARPDPQYSSPDQRSNLDA